MDTFAAVFVDLTSAFEVVETVAGRFFGVMREKGINTTDELNQEVSEGYVANGWSQTKGRPKAGATEKPAPDIVQTYVSIARRGLDLGLDVKSFETMYQLRKAIAETPTVSLASGPERLPELKGITIAAPTKLTGGFCHDVAVYTRVLPEDKRLEMEDRVRKVMKRYERYVYKALSVEDAA